MGPEQIASGLDHKRVNFTPHRKLKIQLITKEFNERRSLRNALSKF